MHPASTSDTDSSASNGGEPPPGGLHDSAQVRPLERSTTEPQIALGAKTQLYLEQLPSQEEVHASNPGEGAEEC